MAKRETPAASARTQPPASASVQIEMRPAPEASQAIALRREAAGLMVQDKASHQEALEFVRACKQLKRTIEEHWSRITRNVDDLKRNLLTLKRQDLEPVETALAMVERRALDYANEQQRIEQERADRERREREEQARRQREQQAAEAEAAALDAERNSPALSAREAQFVELYLQRPIDAVRHANTVGYKDYRAAAERLLASPKIQQAIEARKQAAAIREQAAAAAQQPISVPAPRAVESQRAKAVGVRTVTTRTAEVIDVDKLIDGVIAGTVDRRALTFDQVFLNQEAKQLQDSFESVYPGCRLIVRQGLAG